MEEYSFRHYLIFFLCHIISLGAEGGTMERKKIENIEVQGEACETTPRPR